MEQPNKPGPSPRSNQISDIDSLLEALEKHGYVADRSLATALFLLLRMQKPLLVEGPAGVGKTEVGVALARLLETRLIRLQCYEGLDVYSAVYEWNYQKQLLAIKAHQTGVESYRKVEKHIFGPDFLLERPLLQSITARDQSPVLLVDEVDRADEAFDAFLLELLADYQISIPELGTIKATHIPYIVLTSNRSRELSDALKRRCLYQWIDYPDPAKELHIVRKRVPTIPEKLAKQIVSLVQSLRRKDLRKPPGVAETLDFAAALLVLGRNELDGSTVKSVLGSLLKSAEDLERAGQEGLEDILPGGS